MSQSLVLSIFFLLFLVAPIQARNKTNPAVSTPAAAPGPSNSDCDAVIFSMMDCLTYLGVPSNDTKPSKSCCDGIKSVFAYNPQCICVGLETSKQMGIPVNNTRALAIPNTCKIPISEDPHCKGLSPGALAPGASPPALSPDVVTPSTSPSSMESPTGSESPVDSPTTATETAKAPSSGTNNLSVSSLTIFAVMVSSFAYVSMFSIN